MASYGGVPLAGLDGFPVRAALQIELSLGVEQVQMYYGMEHLTAVMGLTAQDLAQDMSILINYGTELVIVIGVHCLSVCVLKDGEFGTETGLLLHVKIGTCHLWFGISLDEGLTVRSDDGAVTWIESEIIISGAVYAYHIALVLNCTGSQQCVPGQDPFFGPVGGVEYCVVVITVA